MEYKIADHIAAMKPSAIREIFKVLVDPEVIAPLSKLKSMLPAAGEQNIRISLGGQLTAKGRDLVYVLGKENYKLDVLGG